MLPWLITLLKGFLPIDGKRIGKIIWVLALSAIAIGIYHKTFIAKTTRIEKIEHYYACAESNRIVGVSANLWKLKLQFGF